MKFEVKIFYALENWIHKMPLTIIWPWVTLEICFPKFYHLMSQIESSRIYFDKIFIDTLIHLKTQTTYVKAISNLPHRMYGTHLAPTLNHEIFAQNSKNIWWMLSPWCSSICHISIWRLILLCGKQKNFYSIVNLMGIFYKNDATASSLTNC